VQAVMKSLEATGDLMNFFHQYSVAFHQRVVSARPPAAVWPDDLSVPFADYGEIVLSVPPREQKFVGAKALETLEARSFVWTGMTTHAIQKLQKEVASGRCVIIENVDGTVGRVVPITGVRLVREDGQVLVVIAKKNKHDVEMDASGQLPAVKQVTGELPGQALQRMLRELLRPFAKEIRIERMGREDVHEVSARFRINTTYIRVIYTAVFQNSSKAIGSPVPLRSVGQTLSRPWKTQSTKWALPSHDDCFLLTDRDDVFVCGWVEPEAENFFRKVTKPVRDWISHIDMSVL